MPDLNQLISNSELVLDYYKTVQKDTVHMPVASSLAAAVENLLEVLKVKAPDLALSEEDREALISQATWALVDYDTDVTDRGVQNEHYKERRADVERIFPILRPNTRTVIEVIKAEDERHPDGSDGDRAFRESLLQLG